MSACPPHTFRRCAGLDGRFVGSVEVMRRNAITEGEPLVPYAGAAAFLIARSRSFTWPRASVKEPIENQANRHL
jgi:hypothetical protein